MENGKRTSFLKDIGALRGSKVIAYITGDRENVNTRVAPDVTRVFFRHLETTGWQPRIDLFLYTRGGDVLTPWRLVNLIREYTPQLSVLIPFRAYSAGTLICLGADEIIMGKMGELGPIDPSVANAFNPQDPSNPTARIPVSVEDVVSYIALARERAEISSEAELADVFGFLSTKIHPLALGNIHRNYALIRSLARKLLALHMEPQKESRIKEIIDNLTEKLYAHNHMIPRQEAKKDIGLDVISPSQELEKLMWQLYEVYEQDLHLLESFNPASQLSEHQQSQEFQVTGGIIESELCLDAFTFKGVISRAQTHESPGVTVTMTSQQWERIH